LRIGSININGWLIGIDYHFGGYYGKQKTSKRAKRACMKLSEDYKLNPYCLLENENHAKDLYPCLRYLK
jgi:hypothetical protein